MATAYRRGIVYGLLLSIGLGGIALGIYQQRYERMIHAGNQAVAERRFDSQDYAQAQTFWLAQRAALSFNQGVMAYKAQNLSRAADYFRQTSQRTKSAHLRTQALYNLGLVMLTLNEVEGAAEVFKETLRLDPMDKDAKYNLERLYHFILRQEGEQGEASMKQAPGTGKEEHEGLGKNGQGRSGSQSGI